MGVQGLEGEGEGSCSYVIYKREIHLKKKRNLPVLENNKKIKCLKQEPGWEEDRTNKNELQGIL